MYSVRQNNVTFPEDGDESADRELTMSLAGEDANSTPLEVFQGPDDSDGGILNEGYDPNQGVVGLLVG